ncbi:response regulator transcription factor [Microbacterium panaciterrae]|uniref:Response regulator transcription factor n=1 Tax=Microbacterium panaciterrae TaxID=985759 RepID=A0ABP8PEQ9_9MICO
MIRVAIADDQALIRDAFRSLVDAASDLTVVGEAADGVEVLGILDRTEVDVVLMDIRMPRIDGLEATRRVLARHPQTRVLVLTTFDRDDWIYDALAAGASGFLLKDVRASQLTDAIRTVAAGDALLAPQVTRRFIERALAARAEPPADAADVPLTARETEVLQLIAAGLSNQEIAERLVIAHSTVKTYVNRILRGLDLRDRTQSVIYAYEHRLVRPESLN